MYSISSNREPFKVVEFAKVSLAIRFGESSTELPLKLNNGHKNYDFKGLKPGTEMGATNSPVM